MHTAAAPKATAVLAPYMVFPLCTRRHRRR
jgi:hypothetical protein